MTTGGRLLISVFAGLLAVAPLAAQSKPKRDNRVITAEEIERAGTSVSNGLDIVQLLRPNWLHAREVLAPGAMGNGAQVAQIRVYIDDRDQGDLEYLRTIPAPLIESLKFMSTNEAGARFGPAAGPGIVVTLRH